MLFSIIIPAYKPNFLKECIDSILAQTYQNFELIIVNDASPYDLDFIVKQYDDKRIHYYKNEKNYGAIKMVDNWNHCLEFVTGEYVINMGDDDKLLPECLSDYAEMMNRFPNLDLYHTRLQFINEKSEVIDIQEERPDWESVYSMIWHFWKGRKQVMGDWLFKVDTLKKNGGFYYLPCAWSSDHISAFIAAQNTGVANSQDYGFQYRVSTSTVTRNNSLKKEKMQAWVKVEDWYSDFLQGEPKDENDQFYYKQMKNGYATFCKDIRSIELRQNLKIKDFGYWLKHHIELRLSRKDILSAYLNDIVYKIKTTLR